MSEERWWIRVCYETGSRVAYHESAQEYRHTNGARDRCDHRFDPVEVVPRSRLEKAEEALRPFVEAAAKWEKQTGESWADDVDERDQALGWGPEFFAEIEVCNRDVLRAREALPSHPEEPKG